MKYIIQVFIIKIVLTLWNHNKLWFIVTNYIPQRNNDAFKEHISQLFWSSANILQYNEHFLNV